MRLSFNLTILAISFFISIASAIESVTVCSICKYKTVSSALASLPSDNSTWTIRVTPGIYTEQVKIYRSNVILRPTILGHVLIRYNGWRDTQTPTGTNDGSATLSIYGTNVKIYNMIIANIYPQTRNIANLALNVQAKKASFYNVKFYGFQDTVYIGLNTTSYFKNCYIEGSVDYVYGEGTATNRPSSFITAQKRATASSEGGFYFNKCHIIPTLPSGPLVTTYNSTISFTSSSQFSQSTYLGRPWSKYARVIYMYSNFGINVKSAGWSQWSDASPNTSDVLFGEYKNSGPGLWNATARASFATLLTDSEAELYSLTNIFKSTSWIDKLHN
ncbi:carbohydrate esterase family 8 protein [Phycomyces blakesleeanus NRRL 1555(-)]|uniref:pectinesterase n=1 Tax=Phycomyces blakesleeanus (strain ATCC 8743b / DSM 1359 / FGSC 10004 / NBRC 33097 / NRRL 1555) TaxID=763407 RepID=A0A167QEG3_PHYB8|nr:carbohydrate esterase family 8 protein [Phycomyces blakesleeanus NRRL 1555(-)]OAD79581.1 carbohydrate esterase family 8 protein [Phycomyces blakesleeanus NRRL 1555(-)]|eukprot:XP_018297621.1 carbohydrate esterase family 8 protein [Phycomyces blakesleeanus NRRL 1555(-)]